MMDSRDATFFHLDGEGEGSSVSAATASLETKDGRTCVVAHSLRIATVSFTPLPTASVLAPDFSKASPAAFPVERSVLLGTGRGRDVAGATVGYEGRYRLCAAVPHRPATGKVIQNTGIIRD